MIKTNVGTVDRGLRAIAGIVLLALTGLQMIGLWGLIGIVPLATAAVGYCPLYGLLGIRTCPADPAS